MKLLLPIFLLLFSTAKAITVSDTITVTGTWNLNGAILKLDGMITGTCTITNALIEGNPYKQIFDTTVTIGSGCRVKEFSMMWFGAKSGVSDNSTQLQRCINTGIDRDFKLYLPGGVFNFLTPLKVSKLTAGTYQQCRLIMYGEGTFWNSKSVLQYNGTDSFALGIHLNKGSEFSNFTLRGRWLSPAGSNNSYYNLSLAAYTNQGLGGLSKGFVIDYYGDYSQRSGSTGIKFHDMIVEKFETDIQISNGYMFNGEIILIDNVQLGDAKYGVVASQPQEKYNKLSNIYSWGSIHTLFTIGAGTQAGHYVIDGGNIAGRLIRFCNIQCGGFFPTEIANFYGESLGMFGTYTSSVPAAINNMVFDFITPDQVGYLNLFTTNTTIVKFTSCNFRYYTGTPYTMYGTGSATYDNVGFNNAMSGFTGSAFVNYIPTIIQGAQVKIKTAVKVSP